VQQCLFPTFCSRYSQFIRLRKAKSVRSERVPLIGRLLRAEQFPASRELMHSYVTAPRYESCGDCRQCNIERLWQAPDTSEFSSQRTIWSLRKT